MNTTGGTQDNNNTKSTSTLLVTKAKKWQCQVKAAPQKPSAMVKEANLVTSAHQSRWNTLANVSSEIFVT